uniref:Uncharacterized protein n=1 Tax=Panagrolaimus sp. JU765 TaxID=591449 RepID=A0AC34Q9K9_9BILA
MFLRAVFNWGIGRIMLTIICWLFNDWRTACLVCTLVASPALILIIFVLPESPTWFHYNDKPEKMRESERKICKLAGIQMKNVKHEQIVEQKKFSDIVRDRKMFKRVAVLWLMWFVASLTGYAMDLGSSNISGNLFLNQIVFAILITLSNHPGSVYAIIFVLGTVNLFVSFNWLVETKNINLDHVDVHKETTEVNSEIEEDELLL